MKRTRNIHMTMDFSTPFMERETRPSEFYAQMNLLIDWGIIETLINLFYTKGNALKGEKPYSGLLLFKMLLVEIWNGLSYVETEDHLNDSISAMRFCGLELEDKVPDHSTLSQFRTALTKAKAMDKLLATVNKQLEAHKLIVKKGVKVDASLTATPLRPKDRTKYEITDDRKEDEVSQEDQDKQTSEIKKIVSDGTDTEARWVKKGDKTIFGFKRHDGVDEGGMILGVYTTTANERNSKGLKPLLEKIPRRHKEKGD